MVVSQKVLDALKQIGLNLYERKLWVALLSRGTATAGELSSLAKVPHSRTYDVLESLAEKGFVMIQNTKPLRYMAVSPNEALERAKKKIKEDLDVMIDRIARLQKSSVLKELNAIHKQGVQLVEPGELTGSLKGRRAMHQQLGTVFKGAKNSISILTTHQGLSELSNNHFDLLKKVSAKGVKIRIATQYTKKNLPVIQKLKKFAEIRKVPKDVNGRFCIVDGNHVIMAMTDEGVHPSQDTALWSQSEHIAGNVLGPMFNALWRKLESA
ncbi:MAG: TrmB family transcriptional regulator [Candidatus Aenigmatarchaeota archaeon]